MTRSPDCRPMRPMAQASQARDIELGHRHWKTHAGPRVDGDDEGEVLLGHEGLDEPFVGAAVAERGPPVNVPDIGPGEVGQELAEFQGLTLAAHQMPAGTAAPLPVDGAEPEGFQQGVAVGRRAHGQSSESGARSSASAARPWASTRWTSSSRAGLTPARPATTWPAHSK